MGQQWCLSCQLLVRAVGNSEMSEWIVTSVFFKGRSVLFRVFIVNTYLLVL